MIVGVVLLVIGVLASLTLVLCLVGIPLAIVGLILLLVGAVTEPARPMVVYAPAYPVPPAPPAGAPCPQCGTPLQWVPQYQRWYCARCNQYR